MNPKLIHAVSYRFAITANYQDSICLIERVLYFEYLYPAFQARFQTAAYRKLFRKLLFPQH